MSSIPSAFDPLGSYKNLEMLDSVHVSCAEDEPYENLVATAFGETYYLEPFGSEGYFAEVDLANVSGENSITRKMLVSIGSYLNTELGSLILYSWGAVADSLPAKPQNYAARSVKGNGTSSLSLLGEGYKLNRFDVIHRVQSSIYSGESSQHFVNDNLGSWTAEQNVRMRIYISKIPGLSYDFKKLVAHTENVKFDALPARKGNKVGIAIFINDSLNKFIEL